MSQEVSPLTSGRLSHSSEPLNGGGSLTGTDSPPISPSDEFDDVVKVLSNSTLFRFQVGWVGPEDRVASTLTAAILFCLI